MTPATESLREALERFDAAAAPAAPARAADVVLAARQLLSEALAPTSAEPIFSTEDVDYARVAARKLYTSEVERAAYARGYNDGLDAATR